MRPPIQKWECGHFAERRPTPSVAALTYYSAVLAVHEELSGEIWSAEAWVDVARTKLMQGDLQAAEAALSQAGMMGTPDAEAPMLLAEILLATDRAKRAHGLLKNVVAHRPRIARAHYLLGLACRDLGLESRLEELKGRLLDLKKIIQANVYHPDFQGSLSIKAVLPALVPDLGYDDLAIQGGMDASVEIARMLLKPETFAEGEREQLRSDLLAYCNMDTWAMAELLERLRELA
jgi:tetratricopeptide (TPR) repeat protein